MKIKRMKIAELNPAAYDPRIQLKPGDPEFERLKESILTFGNVEPIVWNKHTGNVVGGHQRLAVLKELGETETEVSVIDCSPKEEKLLNVTLNKVKGDWDYDKLSELLKMFDPEEIKLSGFSPQELAVLCADVNAAFDAALEEFEEDEELASEGNTDGIKPIEEETMSYVVALTFDTVSQAVDWLSKHGWGEQYRKGTHSTVVRVEQAQ